MRPVFVLLTASFLASCAKTDNRSEAVPGASDPETLAVVGKKVIRAKDVAHRIKGYSPTLQGKYRGDQSLLLNKLEQLVEEQQILAVAKERGLDRDPRIQEIINRHLVTLVKEDVLQMVTLDSVTEKEIRAYYTSHPEQFSTPLELRARHILLPSEEQAKALLEQAQKAGQTDAGFAALARQHSIDEATKAAGGDLGMFSSAGRGIPAEVFEVARTLTEPGALGGPVRSARGWHLVRLTSLQPPKMRPLEQVRVTAKIAAYKLKRKRLYQRFRKELEDKVKVKRFPQRIDKVRQYLE